MESLTFAINQFEGVLPNSIGNLSTQLHLLCSDGIYQGTNYQGKFQAPLVTSLNWLNSTFVKTI
ncbi:hypothetical protein CFP56_025331 [Quercus suber]|uniref:Non-specific serine/threonine protein kinase n=1 Tax=Quercus suber TaxID=58331 RepID=A0AAW0K414_QUESU